MHAQDDHGLQWNFIKKSWSLVYRQLIARYWILPMIYIKILRAHGLQQQEELEFCVWERGFFWVGQLGVADPWWWCKVLNMWFWILSKDFRIPVMWSQGNYSSILRVTTTTRGWICFCSQLMIAACESEEML